MSTQLINITLFSSVVSRLFVSAKLPEIGKDVDGAIEKDNATFKGKKGGYEDEKGFCKAAHLEEVRKHKHVLTPGRYAQVFKYQLILT
ncbi:Type I restriction-modification system, DNA-methyltransferase subunit M [hydrothermal vent metagenome]|uniref:Type I restriction-modification system, DNA-methyltransferase subunit M n=1 Tax=hydrothermal vent metagenome TaxID=652676 RepID=A0A3B1D4B0_9ZZZZ